MFDEPVKDANYVSVPIMYGLNEELAIIAYGLKTMKEHSSTLVHDLRTCVAGKTYEEDYEFSPWLDDIEVMGGWGDPFFDGFRIVLYGEDSCFLHIKHFVGGQERKLSWEYLTSDNAREVVEVISCWPDMDDVAKYLKSRFRL